MQLLKPPWLDAAVWLVGRQCSIAMHFAVGKLGRRANARDALQHSAGHGARGACSRAHRGAHVPFAHCRVNVFRIAALRGDTNECSVGCEVCRVAAGERLERDGTQEHLRGALL
eukprot:7381049-Prymnesium_polylepis.1